MINVAIIFIANVMGIYLADLIIILIFLKCGCWEIKGCYNITQLCFGCVLFGMVLTTVVFTSINYSQARSLSSATKAIIDSGINECSDSYTQIPQE